MTTIQEAARKALASLELYDHEDLASCEARHELRTALAQQGEPVCHGCGIPAGDVHMSTCKSGKWPSRVSNGDTAAPAPVAQQGEQAKPAAYITPTEQGPMVWTQEMYDEACTYCDDGEFPIPLYTVALRPTSGDYAQGYAEGFNDACKPAPQAQERSTCNHCDGTGWVARDPDIGTDQECFVCDGSGYVKEEPAPQPAQGDRVTDKAWAQFCGLMGEKAPYPGMIDAFERHYAQSFKDKDWRNEASVWAQAWKAALQSAQPVAQPLTLEQILDIVKKLDETPDMSHVDVLKTFARAIEAAHGIREVK